MFDYFYGAQAEQFAFYRIPKVLFTDSEFRTLSAESKILYGILLDRVSLSAKNGWIDSQGRVYIIYTIEDIMGDLNCGNKKARGLFQSSAARMAPDCSGPFAYPCSRRQCRCFWPVGCPPASQTSSFTRLAR